MNKYIYLLIPLFCVYFVSYIYPVNSNTGKEIPFRPPAWVFSVVWPILLILIGYSWYLRPNLSLYYVILIILLSIWTILFSINKIFGLIDIIIILLLTLFLINKKFKKKSSYSLIPLILWLSFASILNYYSI